MESPSDDKVSGSTPSKSSKEDVEKEDNETALNSTTPQVESRAVTGWKWFFICVGLYCAIFLYGLDNTVAADIQSAVVETYGDVSQLAWLGTGFPLGSVATILTL